MYVINDNDVFFKINKMVHLDLVKLSSTTGIHMCEGLLDLLDSIDSKIHTLEVERNKVSRIVNQGRSNILSDMIAHDRIRYKNLFSIDLGVNGKLECVDMDNAHISYIEDIHSFINNFKSYLT